MAKNHNLIMLLLDGARARLHKTSYLQNWRIWGFFWMIAAPYTLASLNSCHNMEVQWINAYNKMCQLIWIQNISRTSKWKWFPLWWRTTCLSLVPKRFDELQHDEERYLLICIRLNEKSKSVTFFFTYIIVKYISHLKVY